MAKRADVAIAHLPGSRPIHWRKHWAGLFKLLRRPVACSDADKRCTTPAQARTAATRRTGSSATMHYLHEIIRVLAIMLGGCVGMWMGAVAMLIARLVRGVLWIRIVGRADWPSWAERYQDGLFILALIFGAGAGARFAHHYLQKNGDDSPRLDK